MMSKDLKLFINMFYIIGFIVSLKLTFQLIVYICFRLLCGGTQRIENDTRQSVPEDSNSVSDFSNVYVFFIGFVTFF